MTYERLVKADQEPGNWLMYSGSYDSWRFSRLDQINTRNVKNLQVKWLFQGRHQEKFETTPLVVDGIMYLTRPENDVFALDAETGRVMWTYSYKNPERTYNCCGRVNRGLAILGNRLFMNTLDMHVIAIDARSGRELWKTEMFDYTASGGYAATGAPLAVKDKVIVGMAGGEHSDLGLSRCLRRRHRQACLALPHHSAARRAELRHLGRRLLEDRRRRHLEQRLLRSRNQHRFLGHQQSRGRITTAISAPGDNLYSCSVLALDPDTGKLKWHYQLTPHDTHDWDATQIPILLDAPFRGRPRKLMAWAARNGFYYLLDRNNGEFLLAKNFVRQTWAKGFDDKGRPQVIPGNEPTPEGIDTVFPGVDGGANWMSHSYSPLTRLLYVFAREERRVFTKNEIRHAAEDNNAAPTGLAAIGIASDGAGGGAADAPQATPNQRHFRRGRQPPCRVGRRARQSPLRAGGELGQGRGDRSPVGRHQVGAQGALASVGRRHGHGREPGLRRHAGRRRLCAGRANRRAPLVFLRQRSGLCLADQLPRQRQTVCFAGRRRRAGTFGL